MPAPHSPASSRAPAARRLLASILALWLGAGCTLLLDGELSDKPAQGSATGAGGRGGGPSASRSASSGTGGGCTTDAQCGAHPEASVCDTVAHACVGCLPDDDLCPSGQYCAPTQACAPGCRTDGDCNQVSPGTLTCDPAAHVCSGCAADSQCPPGLLCDVGSAACLAGCNAAHDCQSGAVCCSGECANLVTDEKHCGSCTTPCDPPGAAGQCTNAVCAVAGCHPGFADCDGAVLDGCEVNTSGDPEHCGGCSTVCAGLPNAQPACSGGQCGLGACKPGFGDCDGLAADGCEAKLATTLEHCGACNTPCAPAHGAGACAAGKCQLTGCATGFADCDGNGANGCEVDTDTDVNHCGTCAAVCSFPNAAAKCSGGVCAVSACTPGYGDCDGLAADGCEVNLNADPAHCGGCASPCVLPHATAGCAAGGCVVTACDGGFADCDGLAANGCETDLSTSVAHCGTCARACSGNHATPTCAGGACGLACASGYGDCDGDLTNGCETDLTANVDHCHTCAITCPAIGGTPKCVSGVCGVSSCLAGLADCDGVAANGCEVDTGTDLHNCGGCGIVCFAANGTAACKNGACVLAPGGCNAGFADCNGNPADGCETSLHTLASCGTCGQPCAPAHANATCATGACVVTSCQGTYADCDGLAATGCEVDTATDPLHCGSCAGACSTANGAASCAGGSCGITCNAGFGNCNGNPADGCETSTVGNVSACGGCGVTCSVLNGTPACNGTTCAVGGCSAGFGDCDHAYATGCETSTLADPNNCGGCGVGCKSINGQAVCSGGACKLTCNQPFASCDGLGSNGCEAKLDTDPQNCGACGVSCLAGRTCNGGVCQPSWVTMSTTGAPEPRKHAAAAWLGDALFVWGGRNATTDLATGGRYDPAINAWTAVSAAGAPSARVAASAVWSGARVIVWGGGPGTGTGGLATGGRYVRAGDTWIDISSTGAPSARRDAIAFWTTGVSPLAGMVVWGGTDTAGPVAGGGRYDDAGDVWYPISATGAPSPRTGYAWAWSGKELLLFGGQPGGTGASAQGYGYNPVTDTWRALSPVNAPAACYGAFGAWVGNAFVVWGGRNVLNAALKTAASYDPAADVWTVISNGNQARSAQMGRTGWSGGPMTTGGLGVFAGGLDGSSALKIDGLRYDPVAKHWTTLPAWPSMAQHEFGAGVWTGRELILWSGQNQGALVAAGERYLP